MDQAQLTQLLHELIATWENEVVEFKQAGNNFDTDKIGEYFAALSNEANLRGAGSAWLIFGVSNATRTVVGSDYRPEPGRLDGLKHQITQSSEPSVTFRNIHVLNHPDGRVVMFEIPAAPLGIPIAWKGHYFARAGESLTSLGLDKLDEIRQQTISQDWTAQVVPGATLADLDEEAVRRARESFALKYANRFASEDVMGWPLATFLDRCRVTHNGAITRTTLLLLGKPEAAALLSPHPAQMTWKLEGAERAYQHFSPPFLLSTTELYLRIRNIQLRLLPEDQLLSIEVSKYDQKIVLEALHNCIAHQDYTRNGRVVVTEQLHRLIFENEGSFFEGSPEEYIPGNKTPRRYRNPFLAQAMVEINMIDRMGYGIYDMYILQARRYFPLPDFDLTQEGVVKITIYGGVVDPAYTRLLIQKTDLPLDDILALDRVQKKLTISDGALTHLRRAKLIEGRKPHLHVSAQVAAVTGNKADYIRTRSLDDAHYARLLTDYLQQFSSASRSDINQFLLPKLSDALTEEQKISKINNLLTKWRRNGLIENRGSDRSPQWILAVKFPVNEE
jgi:ATP-dependent DNA helicase RecG